MAAASSVVAPGGSGMDKENKIVEELKNSDEIDIENPHHPPFGGALLWCDEAERISLSSSLLLPPAMEDTVVVGHGGEAESAALQAAMAGLSEESFSRLRVCYEVPGRPRGPHVSATQLIEVVTGTTQTNASHAWTRMKSQRGRPSEVVNIPAALQIIMMLPGRTAAKVRVKASVLLTRFLAGDLTLVGEVYGMAALQDYFREHNPTHPLCTFREAVIAGQTTSSIDMRRTGTYSTASSFDPQFSQEPVRRGGVVPAALPEPFLDWQKDLGALRKEIPAAKAALKLLFEIEIAAGVLPKNTKLNPNQPQVQYRALAEGALSSSRASIQTRIDTIAARGAPDGRPAHKRARTEERRPAEQLVDAASNEDDEEEDILKVSAVMHAASVWEPVRKSYMSDLSNRMLQVKCHDTNGSFSERRLSVPFGIVHKYKKPEDWPVAHQALQDTKSLYEKRIRELLEDAFVRAGTYDDTLAFACSEAARRLATQLRTVDLDVVVG